MVDNSRGKKSAFTVCRIQLGADEIFDLRQTRAQIPAQIGNGLDIVSPLPSA